MVLKDILWTLVNHTRVHIRLKSLCETEELHGEAWWLSVILGEDYPELLNYTVEHIRVTSDNILRIVAYKD